jgi:hypothetical protein
VVEAVSKAARRHLDPAVLHHSAQANVPRGHHEEVRVQRNLSQEKTPLVHSDAQVKSQVLMASRLAHAVDLHGDLCAFPGGFSLR